ncbi:hypothetical protein A0J61_01056 [Choanephora cucurbitarum]|uniref:Uncharacterized protein n=1 Tax=Choanephora cucurbitarum TaxID=101091 RepID=A0A1C7NP52_9FUNG|nr:hypothetical protein A0J61_01056 [Choanephora cucurbitarum]
MTDYKIYDYLETDSINHPDADKFSCSVSSLESHHDPSHIQSEILSRSIEHTPRSVQSEPIFPTLTEQALARHDQSSTHDLVEKMEQMKLAFEEKIKRLEAQLEETEQDLSQSRCDIEELDQLERQYDQSIQTDMVSQEIDRLQQKEDRMVQLSLDLRDESNEWKSKYQQVVDQTKQLVWDTPFIPYPSSVCRQLPVYSEDDEDICDYHRERYHKAKAAFEHEKGLHQDNHQMTLNRLRKMVGK